MLLWMSQLPLQHNSDMTALTLNCNVLYCVIAIQQYENPCSFLSLCQNIWVLIDSFCAIHCSSTSYLVCVCIFSKVKSYKSMCVCVHSIVRLIAGLISALVLQGAEGQICSFSVIKKRKLILHGLPLRGAAHCLNSWLLIASHTAACVYVFVCVWVSKSKLVCECL